MNAATITLPTSLILKIDLTDEQFFQLCQKNRDYRFERTASGELLIMPPTDSDTGNRNFDIVVELGIWNKQSEEGRRQEAAMLKVCSCSVGFKPTLIASHRIRDFGGGLKPLASSGRPEGSGIPGKE